MISSQKRYVNIIFLILVVIIFLLTGYLIFQKAIKAKVKEQGFLIKRSLSNQTQPKVSFGSISKQVNWEKLIPAIRTLLGPTLLDVRIEELEPISIFQKKDITGDGIDEALVNIGNGGAHTISLTLIMAKENDLRVASFKQKDGKISPLIFSIGASVMDGETVEMIPDKNAIYAGHWSKAVQGDPFNNLSDCAVEAYQWNLQTETFDFNPVLSREIRFEFCRRMSQELNY